MDLIGDEWGRIWNEERRMFTFPSCITRRRYSCISALSLGLEVVDPKDGMETGSLCWIECIVLTCRMWGSMFRFVRFVSTPEVLERVGTVEAELVQLVGAIKEHTIETTKVSVVGSWLSYLEPRTAQMFSTFHGIDAILP